MFSTNTNTTLAAINTNLTLAATTNTTLAATTNTTMVNMSLAYFPPVQFTTIIIIIISRTLTEVDLPVASSPHRVAVVDADVLPLLDVHRCSDNHPVREGLGYFDQNNHLEPEVSVEVFACIVDAGVLQ